MDHLTAGGIVFETLCTYGKQLLDQHERDTGETRRNVYLLAEAEETHYAQIPYYRDQLAKLKAQVHEDSIRLQRHVAHCPAGCKRATDGAGFAARANAWDRAPSRQKPPLPGAAALAAMLVSGQTLEGIAAVHERHVSTIQSLLNQAGYSTKTGLPLRPSAEQIERPRNLVTPFQFPAWMNDGLCAQTDPEAFFPEKGGSTREAKSVCSRCTVQAECLDYAIENNERFGIYGGLSDRERRKLQRQITKESA